MSWQLASTAIVLATLACALAWWERSRPPVKLIAVVATLAALAALGRDAFAAIPDVKPITAIVLVSGVAFGAGPGVAVGALSGLASNILLGEGPWTPWQMLGWGLVGLLGAGLGRAFGRRLHPLLLALACAVAAEAFNLVVDAYTWTGTGNHTLAAFGVVLGTALAFDLTHILASFLFGLAFGGVLLRMLVRVRERMHVEWESPTGAVRPLQTGRPGNAPGPALRTLAPLLAVSVLVVAAASVALAASGSGARSRKADSATARLGVAREIGYLASAQNPDGGFGGARGQGSSELYSAWVAMGLAAAGRDPLAVRRAGHSVLDALRAQASGLHGAGDLERTILALHACGVSARALPGGDPVARLLAVRRRDGSFEGLSNITAFAVLALRAAGRGVHDPLLAASARWLARQQGSDGGFGFAAHAGPSDVDDTAAVLQALRAAGVGDGRTFSRATSYLLRAENPDGGFPQQPGGASNAQSTAWAVQALDALGRDSSRPRGGSRSPLAYLLSLVGADGSVRYSRTGTQTPVWVTAQALTALAGRPLPIAPVPPRSTAAARTGPQG